MAQRAKVVQLSDHRRSEPEPEKKRMFSDDNVTRIIEALKQEIQAQLKDHHSYLRALVEEAYLDLHKSAKGMKKDIATLRRELAEMRTESTTAKAVEAGKLALIHKDNTKERA